MDPTDHASDAREAASRLRRVLLDPPDRGPEPPGYLAAHGARLESVALVRRGEAFRVLAEATS